MSKETRSPSQDGGCSPQAFHKDVAYCDVQFGDVVGRGAFGIVHKAMWSGMQVAVKVMEGDEATKSLNKEVHQLSKLRHENIIRLYGVCSQKPKVCLIMEYAENGSLYDLLHPSSQDTIRCEYTFGHVMSWALQCARAMEYLHGLKPTPIVHRDLKPPNMLLKEHGTVLKICDFGTARPQDTSHMTSNKGSAAWMAPEVFEGPVYSEKCDVFSFGIVLWEMITRRKPFDDIGPPPFRIMWAVHNGFRPPLIRGIPMVLEELMICAWDKDTKTRPPFSAIVLFLEKASMYVSGGNAPLSIPVADEKSSDSEVYSGSVSSCNQTARLQYSSDENTGQVFIQNKDKVVFTMSSPILSAKNENFQVGTPNSGNQTDASPFPLRSSPLPPTHTSVEEERWHTSNRDSPVTHLTNPVIQPGLVTPERSQSPRLPRFSFSPENPDKNPLLASRFSPTNRNDFSSPRSYHDFSERPPFQGPPRFIPPNEVSPEIGPPRFPTGFQYFQTHAPYSHVMRTPSPGSAAHGYQQPLWTERLHTPSIPENSRVDDVEAHHHRMFPRQFPGNDTRFAHAGGRDNFEQYITGPNITTPNSNRSSTFPRANPEYISPLTDNQFGFGRPGLRLNHSASDSRYEDNLWHLLEPEIMPLRPIESCKESMEIYNEHSELINEYITLQKDFEYLLQRRREIEQQLDDEKREQQRSSMYLEEYLKLLEEKQSLSAFLGTLKQELHQLSSFRGSNENLL